ncbi:hypothetical protein BH24ACT5_BH24ACT5_10700 [soil metagenome]
MRPTALATVIGGCLLIVASASSSATAAGPPPTPPPPVHPTDVHDPQCVVIIQPGDSLSSIADSFDDPTITGEGIQLENGISNPDRINAGAYLDVCVGNQINDVNGAQQGQVAGGDAAVKAEQERINMLFAPYGSKPLLVDGISGPLTEQMLCATRLLLDIPLSLGDMALDSPEGRALMRATALRPPPAARTDASRWILVDKTCQILVAGEGDSIKFVFPTSTGEEGFETRDQRGATAFRYDPATENGGWHNSTVYPVPEDNPLNGNMYKPLYFDGGQAIHGANNVPTAPASKGCVRLRVDHQDTVVAWLGLGDVNAATYNKNRIGLIVTVQGNYA